MTIEQITSKIPAKVLSELTGNWDPFTNFRVTHGFNQNGGLKQQMFVDNLLTIAIQKIFGKPIAVDRELEASGRWLFRDCTSGVMILVRSDVHLKSSYWGTRLYMSCDCNHGFTIPSDDHVSYAVYDRFMKWVESTLDRADVDSVRTKIDSIVSSIR